MRYQDSKLTYEIQWPSNIPIRKYNAFLQEPQKRDKIIRSKFNKEYVNPT